MSDTTTATSVNPITTQTEQSKEQNESSSHMTMRHSPSQPPLENTLTKTILARHSTRIFHENIEVPMSIIERCLELAQHSPSSTNIQPWHLWFTSGPKLTKVKAAMIAAVTSGQASTVPAIPDKFKPYRSQVGHVLYGPNGYNIARSDKEGHKKAQLRNYEFFGAPMMAVVGIDKSINQGADNMSVGLYVQTLVLLLTEQGLGTCLEVSTSGYPDVLKREMGIPDDYFILCTLAIGYEDDSQHINTFKMPRDSWRDHVDFVME